MNEVKIDKETRKRFNEIFKILEREYPEAKISLKYKSPFQLLVATILSAQCTDKQVNSVTKKLFAKYKTPEDFSKIPAKKLEEKIYSTGFYKAKAKNIKSAADKIISDFDGEVPGTMKKLLMLPGVGRKTANVVLGHCFKPEGVVVDTHVIRITNRLGLVETKNPEIIERILNELTPKKNWAIVTHYFINHGRKICLARKPKCEKCPISALCPSAADYL